MGPNKPTGFGHPTKLIADLGGNCFSKINDIDVDRLFDRYQECGFLYEKKLKQLEPVLPLVKENWRRALSSNGRLLYFLTSEDAERAASDDTSQLDAWLGLAGCKRMTNEFDGALELLDLAETAAARLGLDEQLSMVHHVRGNILFPIGLRSSPQVSSDVSFQSVLVALECLRRYRCRNGKSCPGR